MKQHPCSLRSFLQLLSCGSLCHATVVVAPLHKAGEIGASFQFSNQDVLGNYNFGYSEGHPSGGSFRKEFGDLFGSKIGSYGLRDADGRTRIVNYVADTDGFRADVKSNEPGIFPQDPASTTINKPSTLFRPVALPPVVGVVKVAPAKGFMPTVPVAVQPPTVVSIPSHSEAVVSLKGYFSPPSLRFPVFSKNAQAPTVFKYGMASSGFSAFSPYTHHKGKSLPTYKHSSFLI